MKIDYYFKHPSAILIQLGRYILPDKLYIKLLWYTRMGYKINLDSPQTFNEKLQWLKLYDRRAIYTSMVDKYEAKKFVTKIIGEKYVIPTLGVWDRFDDIDFSTLPNQFVLKCTHDSGGLVIVRDKKEIDLSKVKYKIEHSLNHKYYYFGREWPYKNVKPRIIAEMYMEDHSTVFDNNTEHKKSLVDYKFFCFNNVPTFLYVSRGLEHHPTAEISFYDLDGNEMYFHRSDYKPYHHATMPDNFEKMKLIAKKLADEVNSPFVRIDLYSIDGQIYFSEITFTPCSGMIPFEPELADHDLGKLLKLPIEDGVK